MPGNGNREHRHRFLTVPARLWILLAAAALLSGCGSGTAGRTQTELHGLTMGTTWSVKLIGHPELDGEALQHRIQGLLDDVNDRMSTYREDSELSRLNRNPSPDWIPVSPELYEVLAAAWEISRASGGAFDATVGPLVNLWGFGPGEHSGEPPTQTGIDAVRNRTGYTRVQLRDDPPAVRKETPDLYIDLSAIAKGYAVDRVANTLHAAGVDEFLVEVGGELRGRGRNQAGDAWKIAIEKPDPGIRDVYAIIDLENAAVATSGGYRNFFEAGDGRTYSHTIDPGSGLPVTHALASVTVAGPSAMLADGHATALMVLGPEDGLRYAAQEGLAAFFVVRTPEGYRDFETPEFARYRVTPDT